MGVVEEKATIIAGKSEKTSQLCERGGCRPIEDGPDFIPVDGNTFTRDKMPQIVDFRFGEHTLGKLRKIAVGGKSFEDGCQTFLER